MLMKVTFTSCLQRSIFLTTFIFVATLLQAQQNFVTVTNPNGATLAYAPTSGVKMITVKGLKFKDLNRNGKLDKYEDWRLPAAERAKDLATKMTPAQIGGLMLYSRHQSIPAAAFGFGSSTYNGKPFDAATNNPADLSDGQKTFLKDDNLRHILITRVQSPEVAAQWNNNVQAFVEGLDLGIPVNTSTDPRHTANVTSEF